MRLVTGNDKVLNMIGMARRAGKVQTGAFSAKKAMQCGDAALVIVAVDASDNIKKKFDDGCRYYEVDYMEYATRAELGKYTGKEDIAVVSITDYNFASGIKDKYISAHGQDEKKRDG